MTFNGPLKWISSYYCNILLVFLALIHICSSFSLFSFLLKCLKCRSIISIRKKRIEKWKFLTDFNQISKWRHFWRKILPEGANKYNEYFKEKKLITLSILKIIKEFNIPEKLFKMAKYGGPIWLISYIYSIIKKKQQPASSFCVRFGSVTADSELTKNILRAT